MTTGLTLTTADDPDGRTRLIVAGEIDQSNVEEFAAALTAAVAAGDGDTVIVVDLTAVTYLDSAAINVLYAHADAIRIVIAPRLVRIMTVCGIGGLVDVDTAPPQRP